MAHLLIENPGVASVEGLTLWGATSKSPGADERIIGMFGSGSSQAVLVCLRKGLFPVVYCGKDRLEWSLSPVMVESTEHKEVFVSLNGKARKSTGSTLAMGKTDWQDNIKLALREFVSNALDAVGGNPRQITVSVVDDNQVRAKNGHTRVFIPWIENPEGQERANEFLKEWFLHFRPEALPHKEGLIRKTAPGRPRFYRRGVLIRTWSQEVTSLWDYNFIHLTLDESRQADDWKLSYEAAKLLSRDSDKFAQTLVAISRTPTLWEAQINTYGLVCSTDKEAALAAVKSALGSNTVVADSTIGAQMAVNKGREALVVPQGWMNAVDYLEGPTVSRELGDHAKRGVDVHPPTPEMTASAVRWIKLIEQAGLATVPPPAVFGFHKLPEAGSILLGYCHNTGDDAGIYLSAELGGELLEQTVIEELAHWYSGSTDFTREFQEWVFRLTVRTLNKDTERKAAA